MAGYGELRGVGGWLAFFLVAFGLLSPVFALISIYSALYGEISGPEAFGDAWGALQVFEWSLLAVSLAGMWFSVWRLVQVHNWTSVRITIATIWLVGPVMLLIETAGVAALLGAPFGEVLAGAGAGVVQPFVFATIWTAYFLKSERVDNTYRAGPESGDVADTFA